MRWGKFAAVLISANAAWGAITVNAQVATPAPASTVHVRPPLSKDIYAGIKSIAVVSAIGESLRFCDVKDSDGKADVHSLPIADWHLDDELESTARAALSKRFEIKDIDADRNEQSRDMPFAMENGHMRITLKEDGLHPTRDVDAILTFVKYPLNVEMPCQGVGVARQKAADGYKYWMFASYSAVALRGTSLQIVNAMPDTYAMISAKPASIPLNDGSLWPQDTGHPTPQQTARIHQALDELLKKTMPDTLMRLGLIDPAEIPGSQSQSSK